MKKLNYSKLLNHMHDPGFFKLNVDDTRSSNSIIGAGGVFRDWNGNWFHGFMLNIGTGANCQRCRCNSHLGGI